MKITGSKFKLKSIVVSRFLLAVCLISVLVFIFNNGTEVDTVSSSKSVIVTEFINKILAKVSVDFQATEHQVRKLAHFSEYMLLGFLLVLNLRLYAGLHLTNIAWPLFLGLFTAVLDEFLQAFTPGRSSMVTDVMIDFGGIASGVLAALLVLHFLSRRRTQKNKAIK